MTPAVALTVALTLVAPPALAQCHPPKYVVARNYIAPHGSIGNMEVSIDPADVSVDNLVCLARTLKRENPEWTDVFIPIFDSMKAALAFQPSKWGDRVSVWRWWEDDRHVRAVYFLDRDPPGEYLQLTPLGWEQDYPTGDFGARIDFRTTDDGGPRCGVKIAGRCLMALAAYRYPDERRHEEFWATATLICRIDRSGRIVSIRQADAHASREFLREAIRNLRTWRFETAPREDAVEFVFGYPGPDRRPGTTDVYLDLPPYLTVRTPIAR